MARSLRLIRRTVKHLSQCILTPLETLSVSLRKPMNSRTTKDIVSKFAALPEGEREALISGALQATAGMKWLPLPGPQTQAYFSPADILLYGGEAGGSKTDSGLGLAFTAHQRSLFCRRQYTDMGAAVIRAYEHRKKQSR